jgi:hypothetical protein
MLNSTAFLIHIYYKEYVLANLNVLTTVPTMGHKEIYKITNS